MNTTTAEKPQTTEQLQSEESKGQLTLGQAKEQMREQLERYSDDIRVSLPMDVSYERFISNVMFSVSKDPNLLKADRRSLIDSCIAAAKDQLLPDGREGALVIYKDKVQWLPMIFGITKKVRGTGQVKEFRTRLVYEGEKFEVFYGDREEIIHVPVLSDERSDKIVAAYAIIELKDGGVEREVMIKKDLDKVKAVSRAQNGPWKSWEGEMHRKSVGRRLLKRVPLSPIIDQILARDEDHFDLEATATTVQERRSIDAPPAPTRQQFTQAAEISRVAEDVAIETDNQRLAMTGDELVGLLERAPTRGVLRTIWHNALTEGDLGSIKERDETQHRAICELYNSLSAEFDKQMAEAAADSTAQTSTEDDALSSGNQTDDAGELASDVEAASDEPEVDEATRMGDTYVTSAIAHLGTLSTNLGINRWYDNTFHEEANARELSEEQIERVNKARLARLSEIATTKK